MLGRWEVRMDRGIREYHKVFGIKKSIDKDKAVYIEVEKGSLDVVSLANGHLLQGQVLL